jgi:hypothetical protein
MPTAEAIEKRIHRCVRVMCPPIPFSVKASRPRTASNLQAWHFPKFSSFVARKATTPKVLGISFYTFKHETFFYMALFSIKQHFFSSLCACLAASIKSFESFESEVL